MINRSAAIVVFALLFLKLSAFALPQTPGYASSSGVCSAKNDVRWVNSIATDLDNQILGIKIVAYRIQWHNGIWSSWYVPGINDDYKKSGETQRRVWACFNDHSHEYIYVPSGTAGLRSFNEFDNASLPSGPTFSGVALKSGTPLSNTYLTTNTSPNLDKVVFRDAIVAYRVRWANGTMSGWMVPGFIDLFQPLQSTARRGWSYFNQYSYEYLSFPITVSCTNTYTTSATFKVNTTAASYQYSVSSGTSSPVISNTVYNPGTVSNLIPGTAYQCKAKISYDGLWSVEFPVINFITKVTKPSVAQIKLTADSYFKVSCATAAERYRFELTNTVSGAVTTYETQTLPFQISGLSSFTRYSVRVLTSVNNVWSSSWSDPIIVTTLPVNPVVNSVNGDYVRVGSIDNAEKYEFVVINAQTGLQHFKTTGGKKFTFYYDLPMDKTFRAYVRIFRNGVWSAYSNYVNFSTSTGSAVMHHAVSMYGNRAVFLVSDANWRAVMTMVPLSTWTTKNSTEITGTVHPFGAPASVCGYPTLIYHEENGIADMDPIAHFLQDYNATTVYYQGTLASGVASAFSNICTFQPMANYLSYWNNSSVVVLCENSYASALSAANYASLIGAPLFIEGYNSSVDLSQKWVIGVGSPAITCDEIISVEEIHNRYMKATATDKMVLTAPADMNTYITPNQGGAIAYEWTTGSAGQHFGKMSLAAPFIASAKQQLLVAYQGTNADIDMVDDFIESEISSHMNTSAKYLTIMSSPVVIPQAKITGTAYRQIDGSVYGDLNGDYYQDLSVGRIYTFSISGTSVATARSLYYNRLTKYNAYATLTSFVSFFGSGYNENLSLQNMFNTLGMSNGNVTADYGIDFPITAFTQKAFLAFSGHGNTSGTTNGFTTYRFRQNKLWLSSPVIVNSGCLTASYDQGKMYGTLFASEMLRRGAVAYIGGTDAISSNTAVVVSFTNNLTNGMDCGTAFKAASQIGFIDQIQPFEPYYILLGDPTFNPGWNCNGNADRLVVTPGAMVDNGSSWTLPVEVVMKSAAVSSLSGLQQTSTYTMDVSSIPAYNGKNLVRANNYYAKRTATGQTPFIINFNSTSIFIPISNAAAMTFGSVTNATRTVNGTTVNVTSELQSSAFAKTTEDGVMFVKVNLDAGDQGKFIPGVSTSLPEIRFNLSLNILK